MRPSRRHRGWLSVWLIGLLLSMQWATAAYACPRLDGAVAGDGPATMAVTAMPDCTGDMPGMDPERPQLCKAHCGIGQQTLNSSAAALDAPPVMAVRGPVVGVLDIADAAALASAMPPALDAGPPAGAPPLYLSLLVLRN